MREIYIAHRLPEFAPLQMPEAAKRTLFAQQYDIQRAAYRQSHEDALFLTVTRDAAPIGRLALATAGDAIAILDILLAAEERGKGVGGALIGTVKAVANEEASAVIRSEEHTV